MEWEYNPVACWHLAITDDRRMYVVDLQEGHYFGRLFGNAPGPNGAMFDNLADAKQWCEMHYLTGA